MPAFIAVPARRHRVISLACSNKKASVDNTYFDFRFQIFGCHAEIPKKYSSMSFCSSLIQNPIANPKFGG